VPYGHPNFGKLMPCICKQQELGQRAAEKLYEISNLGAFSEKTFKNFNPAVPGVQGAFYAAQKYAEKPQGWMVIFGNYGAGKTHLAAAIANELLTTHHRVLFAVVPDLLDHLRATFGPSSEVEYDERFESIRDVQVLFLDDLGTENTTPWAREKLFQIVNHRYNYRLSTVFTSNRKPEDIDPRTILQKIRLPFNRVGVSAKRRHSGVRSGEEVVVDVKRVLVSGIEKFSSDVC